MDDRAAGQLREAWTMTPAQARASSVLWTLPETSAGPLQPSERDCLLVLSVGKLLGVELDEWQERCLQVMFARHRQGRPRAGGEPPLGAGLRLWHFLYCRWHDADRAGRPRRAAVWGWLADRMVRGA